MLASNLRTPAREPAPGFQRNGLNKTATEVVLPVKVLCVPETQSHVDVGVQGQEVAAAEHACTDTSIYVEQTCNIYVSVNVGRH
jgi:hypothetical protein